ncbi:MAG TPA: caspase family protein [Kofleriaceae bacterium]|nr:caspase family protein [Kofleriaceae bacterium]
MIGASLKAAEGGLEAEELDAERMAAVLRQYGFEVERRWRAEASRDGILAGYRRLIERVGPGDAAVVYFAGHGGRVVVDPQASSSERVRVLSTQFQFIAPTDYAQRTEDDFRGISSWELSQLLGQLTDKTDNVTVILDCCFSSQMSRAGEAAADTVVRALPKLTWRLIGDQLDEVRARFGPIDGPGPMGNPKAVRFAACGDWQTAVQILDAKGQPGGLFTQVLIAALEEIGDAPVSWRALGDVVRARVLRTITTQRPVVEGPVKRRLFSVQEIDAATIPLTNAGGVLRLGAGRLTGVSVGDVYGVTRVSAASLSEQAMITRVRVERVEALHSLAEVVDTYPDRGSIPREAVAWPIARALARHAIWIDAPEPERAALEAAIARSARLEVAASQQYRVGELRVRSGELHVVARDGRDLEPVSRAWLIPEAIRQLEQLAVAQTLIELEGEHGLPDSEVEVEWGTVRAAGVRIPQPAHGAELGLSDRIYLRVTCRAAELRFVHVFNIGLSGNITQLSAYAPSGIRLGPGQDHLVGIGPDPASPRTGLPLAWPAGLRRSEPGVDSLIVIVTTRSAELRALETDNQGPHEQARAANSQLLQLLAQIHEGGTWKANATPDPFCVVRRSFVLHPQEAPIAEAPMEISGQVSGQASGQASGQMSAQMSGQTSGPA